MISLKCSMVISELKQIQLGFIEGELGLHV